MSARPVDITADSMRQGMMDGLMRAVREELRERIEAAVRAEIDAAIDAAAEAFKLRIEAHQDWFMQQTVVSIVVDRRGEKQ